MKTKTLICVSVLMVLPLAAIAGRGSSPLAIRTAIGSGSIDAIEAELERAEHLVCAVCVDYVRPLLDHRETRVRQVAAWWLARRGVRQQILQEMMSRVQGNDSTPARNAADVLGELRMTQALGPLSNAMGNGSLSVEARVAAAKALGTIGDLRAQSALMNAMSSNESDLRAAALASLRSLRGFDHPEAAVARLSDGSEAVRIQAIYTLGMTRSAAGVAELERLLESDPSANVRKKAAWALGEIGAAASGAAPALSRAAAGDSSPLVRSLAQAALAKLGH